MFFYPLQKNGFFSYCFVCCFLKIKDNNNTGESVFQRFLAEPKCSYTKGYCSKGQLYWETKGQLYWEKPPERSALLGKDFAKGQLYWEMKGQPCWESFGKGQLYWEKDGERSTLLGKCWKG